MSDGKTGNEHDGHVAGGNGAGADEAGRRFAIDMRRFEPRERLPLFESSLSALRPGEVLEVVLEYWPDVLPRHAGPVDTSRGHRGGACVLQGKARRSSAAPTWADGFAWWTLGEGEDGCALAIRRHADAGGRCERD